MAPNEPPTLVDRIREVASLSRAPVSVVIVLNSEEVLALRNFKMYPTTQKVEGLTFESLSLFGDLQFADLVDMKEAHKVLNRMQVHVFLAASSAASVLDLGDCMCFSEPDEFVHVLSVRLDVPPKQD